MIVDSEDYDYSIFIYDLNEDVQTSSIYKILVILGLVVDFGISFEFNMEDYFFFYKMFQFIEDSYNSGDCIHQ